MTVPAELASDGPVDLLPLALSRPNEALERARKVLADDPGLLAASVARQAIGTVLREYGDIDAALVELRIARRLARRAGSDEREADVLGTLGVALIFAGRSVSGRNALNAAVQQSTGHLHTRMVFRRGAALLILGRHDAALEDLNTAIVAMRAADDQLWEARALQERAVSYLSSGSARRATADLRRAEELFAKNGQELESVEVTVNRGLVALRLGDLPDALSCFDEAAERLQRLGTSEPDLSIHRCAALTAAGLVRRIEPAGSPALFERRVGDNHHHIVCRSCGVVADVDCAVGEAPCLTASDDHGFSIDEAEVVYWGLCPGCSTADTS